jgi:hypothetical protein
VEPRKHEHTGSQYGGQVDWDPAGVGGLAARALVETAGDMPWGRGEIARVMRGGASGQENEVGDVEERELGIGVRARDVERAVGDRALQALWLCPSGLHTSQGK